MFAGFSAIARSVMISAQSKFLHLDPSGFSAIARSVMISAEISIGGTASVSIVFQCYSS